MLRLLLTLFLLTNALSASAQRMSIQQTQPAKTRTQQKKHFQHIGVERGLHSFEIIDISLDPQGFLWFGYPDAVARFDGYTLHEYTGSLTDSSDIAPSAAVSFGTDRHGNFYIGKASFGLQRWDPRSEHFQRYAFKDSSATSTRSPGITKMLLDRDGRFWLGTVNGLRYYDEAKAEWRSLAGQPKDIEEWDISALCQDSNNTIWFGGHSGFASYNVKSGKFQRHVIRATARPGHEFPVVYSAAADRENRIWLATSNGLFCMNALTGTLKEYKTSTDQPDGLANNFIIAIEVDAQGKVWMNPENCGVQIFDPGTETFERYQHDPSDPTSLANNNVRCIYQDVHGTMWIGMGGYIDCYDARSQQFTSLSNDPLDPQSLNNDMVRGMYEDRDGMIWMGTSGGGLNKYDPQTGKFEHFIHDARDPHSISINNVQGVTEDHLGNLWIGTWGNGVSKFNKRSRTFENLPPIEGRKDRVSNITNTGITTDRDGDIWVATWGTGVDRIDPKTGLVTNYRGDRKDSTTLTSNHVFCVMEDRAGGLWVGTSHGVGRIDRHTHKVRRYYADTANNTGINAGLSLLQDHKGRMWVGAHGSLFLLDPATGVYTPFGPDQGYPFNRVIGLLEDSSGMLWVRTERGLAVFDPDAHTFILYDRNDGILPSANSFGTALHDSRGNLMFGSSGGLNIFRPSFIESRSVAPTIALTSLVIGGVKRPAYPGLFKAESDQNSLDIEFATLSFNRPEKNQYRYKLEGYDDNWIEAGTRRFVTYTNLEPGRYTFRVRGSNDGGRWSSNEASFQTIIAPAWYQHWWFNVAVILLIVSMGYSAFRVRVRNIEHQKRHLEEQVVQRTQEVNRQKAALEKALTDLKSAEVQLIQNEKMASLGQLTAGIAHELNNPINFVSSNIQPLKRDISDVLALLDLYMNTQAAGGVPEDIRQMQEDLDIKVLLAEVTQLLKGIEEGATRTASIVKGLRNFSRLDQDSLILTDINQGIESTLALLSSQLGSRIKVHRNFSKLPLTECFPGQLNQVFMNILTNAIQAIDGEGEISIATARKHDVVSISIADSGQGMNAETIQKIFDPFYTTKSVGQGTGLGLSVSYGIIKKQGGSIEVASEVGKGSTFTIHLPLRVAESANA